MRRRPFEFDDGRRRPAEIPPPIALARLSDAQNADGVRIGRRETLPLSLIAGLTEEAEFDLKRSGVDNVESLAVANPIVLLTETTYAFAQIVDWIGEALLLHYFGPEQAGQLRRFGVRTILNLLVACDEQPPAALARLLCQSDDPAGLAFVAATLHADPLVTRLSELQNPGASRIVGTIMEAGATARSVARMRGSRAAWHEYLRTVRDDAYGALSPRERLRAAHSAVLFASLIIMLAALAVLWQFGGAALDWVADRRFPSLSRDALPIFFCAVATGLLIAFAISLRSAFTAPRALHRSYVRLGQLVIFIAGVLLGMAIWSGLGDAVQPKSARIEPAARSESPRAAALGDEASASVGAGAPKIGLAAEAASMMPPGEAIAGSPEISAESSAEAVSPVADAAPPAEPEVTVDVTVVETISPPEVAAVPVTAPADDDPPVGETLGDEPVPPVEPTAIAAALVEIAVSDAVALRATARAEEEPAAGEMVKDERASAAEPQQRDEPESPASPAMIAAPDAPTEMIEAKPAATVEIGSTGSPPSIVAAVETAAPAPDAPPPAIGMNVAPAAKPRQAASSLRDSKRYFVQFGTYHLLASAESDCPAFSSLGAVTIVRSRVPEIGFYCRTATSRDHDEAMSLVRAAKATMNRVAMLVADARPTN